MSLCPKTAREGRYLLTCCRPAGHNGECWCDLITYTAEYVADVLPDVRSDDRRHVLADDCWCEPTIRPYRRIHEGATDE